MCARKPAKPAPAHGYARSGSRLRFRSGTWTALASILLIATVIGYFRWAHTTPAVADALANATDASSWDAYVAASALIRQGSHQSLSSLSSRETVEAIIQENRPGLSALHELVRLDVRVPSTARAVDRDSQNTLNRLLLDAPRLFAAEGAFTRLDGQVEEAVSCALDGMELCFKVSSGGTMGDIYRAKQGVRWNSTLVKKCVNELDRRYAGEALERLNDVRDDWGSFDDALDSEYKSALHYLIEHWQLVDQASEIGWLWSTARDWGYRRAVGDWLTPRSVTTIRLRRWVSKCKADLRPLGAPQSAPVPPRDWMLDVWLPDPVVMWGDYRSTLLYLDQCRIALALHIYRSDHGTFPASLESVTTLLGGKLPEDAFSDHRLIYRRTSQGYELRSVGPVGIDTSAREWPVRPGGLLGDDVVLAFPPQ